MIRDNGILSSQLVPFAIQEHSEDMLAFRIVDVAAFFFYFKSSFLNLCQELFLGISIQVLDNSIVVEDLQVVIREDNSHEEVEFFITCVIWMFFSSLQSHFAGRSTSVMSVCDVQCRDLIEETCQALNQFRIIYDPQRMLDAVFGSNVVLRLMICNVPFHDAADPLVVPVSQKYRFRISVADIKVVDSVDFLLNTSKLMLFDRIVLVFIYCYTANDSSLCTSIHDLTVDVQCRFFFLYEYAVFQTFCDIVSRLFIHGSIVSILLLRQIDLCSTDMKEAVRIFCCHFCSFLTVHNVVRQGNNLVRILCIRADRFKRFYCSHFT